LHLTLLGYLFLFVTISITTFLGVTAEVLLKPSTFVFLGELLQRYLFNFFFLIAIMFASRPLHIMICSVNVTLAGDIFIIVGCVFVHQSFFSLFLGHLGCLLEGTFLELDSSLSHFKFTLEEKKLV
jgi:hypothetical protein